MPSISSRLVIVILSAFVLFSGVQRAPPPAAPDAPADDTARTIPGPPTIVRTVALSNTSVQITFNKPMAAEAETIGFYRITPRLTVLAAALSADGTLVTLTTTPQEDVEYTLLVGSVMAADGEMFDSTANTNVFFGIPAVDTTGPRVLGAIAVANTSVLLAFNEPVSDSAENATNYRVAVAATGLPLVCSSAVLNRSRTEVVLTTLAQEPTAYTITVTHVEDLAGNLIDATGNAATFTGLEDAATRPADNELPRVVGAISTGNTSVVVAFSKMMGDSALVPSNYLVGQTNVVAEAGGLIVTGAAFLGGDRTAVVLTTLSQSQVEYAVTVVNVKDMNDNPLAPKQAGVGVVVDPTSATFWGTGPSIGGGGSGATLPDTDRDGLTDDVEQRGWIVTIVRTDGTLESRDVSSDPYAADTDGDGLNDQEERQRGTDPRNADTDFDLIADGKEVLTYFSSPIHQDTDADKLPDPIELTLYKTSPIRPDTDGDGFTDRNEVIDLNRNPRIADLPRPQIDVGDMALRLDTRFSFTDTQGVKRSTEKSTATTLTEGTTQTFATSDSQTITNVVNVSTEITNEAEYGLSADAIGFSGKTSVKIGAGYSYSNEHTTSVSRESSKSAQEAYQDSLTVAEAIDETQAVTREVVGASVDLALTIGNVGNIAFTMTNIEVTALQQDPLDRRRFLPVATLVPAVVLNTGQIPSYTTGPGVPERGPFLFSSREVFPSLVDDLLKNPRGLVFKVANFDVTDEFGRNLAFTSQTVNERTVGITIDYGNGTVDRFRIATNGSLDDRTGQYIGGFDSQGRETGLPMGYILQQVLDMEPNGTADAIIVGEDGCAQTWASGDDVQVVSPVCPPVAPGGIIIEAGPNGRLESIPRGDDRRIGNAVVDGGDGCANTVAAGDDVQIVAGACAAGADDGVVVLAGPNGVIDSTPPVDATGEPLDDITPISGYATAIVSRCDGNTMSVIVERVALTADTLAAGDDVQVIAYGNPAIPGGVIVSAGANGVLDTVPHGNDIVALGSLTIVEPPRTADTTATGDDVQVVPPGNPVAAGAIIVAAGPNGVLDTAPAGNDARVGPGYTCANGCPGGLCKETEILSRVKATRNDPQSSRFWVLLTDADIDPGADFDDIILKAGDTIALAFVQDKDSDRLYAREEYLFGSSDLRVNTDGCPDPNEPFGFLCNDPSCAAFDTDCLTDFEEVKVGWEVAVEGRSAYPAYADPVLPDSDADGVRDDDERVYGTDPRKRDTDDDGISDGDEIYGFAVYTRDRQTVIRHVDPYQSAVIIDGGNGVVNTPLAGDDIIVNATPAAAGDVIIAPGPNGVLDSLPAGDDEFKQTQIILDGGNGVVETAPAGDDEMAPGAGNMLVTVTFQSFDAGSLDCDADDALIGACDTNATNEGDRCTNHADCFGSVGGTCDMNVAGTCSDDGAPCNVDADCTTAGAVCFFDCDSESLNAGDDCTNDDHCDPTPAACDLPSDLCVGGLNAGATCVTDADCTGGGSCQTPYTRFAGEYNFTLRVTRNPGGELLLEETLQFLPIDGDDGSVLLEVPAHFPLESGGSFEVFGSISEIDDNVDSPFEQTLPGNETPVPPAWTFSEVFQAGALITNQHIERTVYGPTAACSCCYDDDAFVFVVDVGGTVRPGGVILRPGPDGHLDSMRGGDDVRAASHSALFATDPLNRDTDGDSLPDGLERALGANPNDPLDVGRFRDSDHDGLTDGHENDGWFIGYRNEGGAMLCRNGDGDFIVVPDPARPPAACVIVTSDPFEPDTDHDGLPDTLEMVLRTDPRNRDTDGDSILDFDEFDPLSPASIHYVDYRDFQDLCNAAERCAYDSTDSRLYGTHPVKIDTDADGIVDAEELFSDWVVSPCDGVPYAVKSLATEADADLDGWGDAKERASATDPNKADTDDDGVIDNMDPFPASCGMLIKVSFVKWEVGDNDCDGVFKGAGDFSYSLTVYRDGSELIAGPFTGGAGINSDGTHFFGVASAPFALTPGQSVTISGFANEDDVSSLDEPPTWHFSRTIDYTMLTSGIEVFQAGPDCFGDDTITVRIDVLVGSTGP